MRWSARYYLLQILCCTVHIQLAKGHLDIDLDRSARRRMKLYMICRVPGVPSNSPEASINSSL